MAVPASLTVAVRLSAHPNRLAVGAFWRIVPANLFQMFDAGLMVRELLKDGD